MIDGVRNNCEHWTHIRRCTPKLIPYCKMSPVKDSSSSRPEHLSRGLLIKSIEICHLRTINLDYPQDLPFLHNEGLAGLLRNDKLLELFPR